MGISTIIIRNAQRIAEPRPDQSEELAVEVLAPVHEIPAMIQDGRIDHAVCVAGLLWWLALSRLCLSNGFSGSIKVGGFRKEAHHATPL